MSGKVAIARSPNILQSLNNATDWGKMYIKHLEIRNFRAISSLSTDLSPHINVIVGPNGVGKTTILQAVRLTKALLAARTSNEAMQVLISLGAASPHFPQRLFFSSIARDVSQPVEVRCTFHLSAADIAQISSGKTHIIQNLAASSAGQNFQNPALMFQFLQSSIGQSALALATEQLTSSLQKLATEPTIILGLTIKAVTGEVNAVNPIAGALIAFLDQSLPPAKSIFSYFPADRALPMGEVNLQLGGPDAQLQLEMHNSQPQLKYHRLKNLLINALMVGDNSGNDVRGEFELIFSKLLRGRTIETISINEVGLLSVVTRESQTGRMVELDSLSSGEKNIALTFLIVANSVARGGIALFDEPELHLNPAVSRDLLSFMMNEYSLPREIQFIMCTHSPEILAGAFASDNCALLHLKSAEDVTRVGRRALDEYADALQRLGTSVSESLLYQGTILVEGDDDVSFLENAFPELDRRYQIKDRGGRKQIEQAIKELQELERNGQKVSPLYFIFDKDEAPTDLVSSSSVKVLQWSRRSIENYMLGGDILYDILKSPSNTRKPITSTGEVERMLRDFALAQIDGIAARDAYRSLEYINVSLQKDDLAGPTLSAVAANAFDRMDRARRSLPVDSKSEWMARFVPMAERNREDMLLTWESRWRELCDGKRLLSAVYSASEMKISESAFRLKIVQTMRDQESEDWTLVKGLVYGLLGT